MQYEQWKDRFLIVLEKWCQSGFPTDCAYEYIKKYNLENEDGYKKIEMMFNEWITSCETEEIQLHRIIAWAATYSEIKSKSFQEEPEDFISRLLLYQLTVGQWSEYVFENYGRSITKMLLERDDCLEFFTYDIISKETLINDFEGYSKQTQHSLECWIEQYGETVKEQISECKNKQEMMFQKVKKLGCIQLDSEIIRINKLGEEIDNQVMEDSIYVFFAEGKLWLLHIYDYY